MKITRFKTGDLIHRTKPAQEWGDRSYMDSPVELLKVTKNLIFFRDYEDADIMAVEVKKLSRDGWEDDWDKFPMTTWKRVKRYFEVKKYPKV